METAMKAAGKAMLVSLLSALCAGTSIAAQAPVPQTPQQLMLIMIGHETDASLQHDRFEYLSEERSERTGGHLWTERVVETPVGKVRMLLKEDGVPLSPERVQQERGRLAQILASPEEFKRREQETKGEEAHARLMLNTLTKGSLLENVRLENGEWRMDYRPNPDYAPSGMEEKVLHGMVGSVVIDAKSLRLVHIDGHLPADVSIGFGFLATIKAGSRFANDRKLVGDAWRMVHVDTDIRGKAVMFKQVARNSEQTRTDFEPIDQNISLENAVALVEK